MAFASSWAIQHPPNLDKPALLAFLLPMLPLPTRHLYLLFPLSTIGHSQNHSPFILLWQNLYSIKFSILII